MVKQIHNSQRVVLTTLIIVVGALVVVGGVLGIQEPDRLVDAGTPTKKVHFTQTITSVADPGEGYTGQQMALVLSPNEGTIYDGSITFTSSDPVRYMVLHHISKEDADKGQPTWTVDGNVFYAVSMIEPEKASGSLEFTGAALALHSVSSEEFTATVSVDGWIRGESTEVVLQRIESTDSTEEKKLEITRAMIPVDIPMHKGWWHDSSVDDQIMYIITDSSDSEYADGLSRIQKWRVEHAPGLDGVPEEFVKKVYIFKNGLKGDGLYGYQEEVFEVTPQDTEYTALSSIVEVTWKPGQKKIVFESVEQIEAENERGRITLEETEVILNMPQIVWPDGGQMDVREESVTANETIAKYEGGQIIKIDKEESVVTFLAHRGWGSDGRTIYHIQTGATPLRLAQTAGVVVSQIYAGLADHSAAGDVHQFKNGIQGTGALGYQPEIFSTMPGSENDEYTPMWRVYIVEWDDPKEAMILETIPDMDDTLQDDMITTSIARPTNSNYIINAPIIDPFQDTLP